MGLSDKIKEIYSKILSLDPQYVKPNPNEIFSLLERGNFIAAHHKFCETILKTAEYGGELWVRIDHIIEEEKESEIPFRSQGQETGQWIELSLLTPAMLEYDQEIFALLVEAPYLEIYRPYFFHFLVNRYEVDAAAASFLSNPERRNGWYQGSFSLDWRGPNTIALSGYVEKAASPIIWSKGTLIIEDKRLPKALVEAINSVYGLGASPCSKDMDIQSELDRLLGGTDFTKARIYYVGNGNCIYLYGKKGSDKIRLLFDIGYRFFPNPRAAKLISPKATHAIRSLRPLCVILSHWDSDHYKGCAYGNRHIFKCNWFAPNCYDASSNAKRLAKYLKVKGKLTLADRTNGRQIAAIKGSNSILNLWLGKVVSSVRKDRNITYANRQGFVLEIQTQSVHCIMMGDVPYQSLFHLPLFKPYIPCDYLVVPHHGAYMNTDWIPPVSSENAWAIVCAKSEKNRPHPEHKCALCRGLYHVILTEAAGFSLDLNLNQKGRLHCRP